jgi:hypothetical protein
MSANLIFKVKGGGHVDFPFQSPIDLTYAVLAEPNIRKKLTLIDEKMQRWWWGKETRQKIISNIEALLKNPNLILTMT